MTVIGVRSVRSAGVHKAHRLHRQRLTAALVAGQRSVCKAIFFERCGIGLIGFSSILERLGRTSRHPARKIRRKQSGVGLGSLRRRRRCFLRRNRAVRGNERCGNQKKQRDSSFEHRANPKPITRSLHRVRGNLVRSQFRFRHIHSYVRHREPVFQLDLPAVDLSSRSIRHKLTAENPEILHIVQIESS